ncbi:hypothetical protein GCM10025784_11660 [Citricoccus nitrophenolicus]
MLQAGAVSGGVEGAVLLDGAGQIIGAVHREPPDCHVAGPAGANRHRVMDAD